MTVLETIRKVQERDEATARLLLGMALYEAVCAEADRVRPQLEADVAKAMSRVAADGLRHLARQPVTAQTAEAADALLQLAAVTKADDDPTTDYWDARGPDGKFISGTARAGIFNALGFATKPRDEEMSNRVRDLGRALDGSDPDAKYNRLRVLGQGLVSTNDPNARAAGTVARLIGDIGPEAQKALEPGIRRTAYRYRGTERRPDSRLQAQAARVTAEMQGPGMDRKRLEWTSRQGVANLLHQVPDRETAAISLAAGKMPPSVGLMYDSRGHLVSEAMGFNGDHYLPFDLSNLKRLHGGSYVRTRTSGGLTDEDIYTGLMTGARHITVVSNSGVFTLEFDKDLRGGRRYSDKARQMVDRYSRLVGAIGSGHLYQNKLSRKDSAKLREDALRRAGGDANVARDLYADLERKAMAAQAFQATDEDELWDRAEARLKNDPRKLQGAAMQRAVREEFNALRADEMQTSVRQYKLDGQGYGKALKALETEFPYFIRATNFEPLADYIADHPGVEDKPDAPRRPRGGTDMGYTPRGDVDAKNAGVRGVDAANPKRRVILGGPSRSQESSSTTGRTSAPAAAAGGGGTVAAASTAPTGASGALDTMVKTALEEKRRDVNTALQRTVKARMTPTLAGEFVEPRAYPSDHEITNDNMLAEPGDAFIQMVHDKFRGNWSQITDWVVDEKDPRILPKMLEAMDIVQKKVRALGQTDFPDEDFKAAKEVLGQLQVLKAPFRAGGGLYDEPPMGESTPPVIPELGKVPLTNEGLLSVAQSNPEAFDLALLWNENLANGTLTHEKIAEAIAPDARRLKAVAQAAANTDPEAPLPLSLLETDRPLVADYRLAKERGGQIPLAKTVADKNTAWALVRLHEIMEASGATRQSTGAADPFALPGAGPARIEKSGSRVSRVRFLDPRSRATQAIAKAIAGPHPARPSLNSVRLPARR